MFYLRNLLKLQNENLEILKGRNDDKFSQKVRNLKAHNTFERYDFQWEDLKDGLNVIQKSSENKRKIDVFDETIMIQEGVKKLVETKIYERSSYLRRIAIEHYTKENDILCNACQFSFNKFYGEKIGKAYIEIHHIKPIFKYEDEELDKTIDKALKNVVPLCSNCHRMIHRDWRNPLKVDYLIQKINQNGIFNRLN